MKKLISIIISVMMIISMLPMAAISTLAADDHVCASKDAQSHFCDVCDELLPCVDNDGDCECDYTYNCGIIIPCVDVNDDHVCDKCGTYCHADVDTDNKCDVCQRHIVYTTAGNSIALTSDGSSNYVNGVKYSGELVIIGNNRSCDISIESGEHQILLNKATFHYIDIFSGSKLSLTFENNNKAQFNMRTLDPGIIVRKNAELVMTHLSTGVLELGGSYCPGMEVLGKVTINGGTVNIPGGYYSYAGILVTTGSLIVNGGTVIANSGTDDRMMSVGIGSNVNNDGGNVTINGGTVIATGGYKGGAGIGTAGGDRSSHITKAFNITINGGTVIATGGPNSAGIGGGIYGYADGITINGGTVIATGNNAPAIGSGYEGPASSNIKIGSAAGCRVIVKESEESESIIGTYTELTDVTEAFADKGALYIAETHEDADSDSFCDYCGEGEMPILNENGFYEIRNAGNLFKFADMVNNGGEAGRELNAIMINDVDLNGKLWNPIGKTGGTGGQHYRGTFDGNGKTVTGLYVEGNKSGLGFFGEVRNGTVRDLTLYGEVVVKEGGNSTIEYIGGAIGSICGTDADSGAHISNVTSYVNVTLNRTSVGRLGGFTGYANHKSVIEACAWYGTFNNGTNDILSGIGGFIGRIQENSDVTIRNCGAYGTVINDGATENIGAFIGVCATNSSKKAARAVVESCIFAGDISGTNADRITAFGTWNGEKVLTNCYYTDKISVAYSGTLPEGATLYSASDAQLSSGEIAYKLGEEWGQTCGEGKPVLGGAKVYLVGGCGDENYSNVNEDKEHVYDENGFCSETHYEPAILLDGYYQIKNAGNLFWLAEEVNRGNNAVNAVLVNDIDLDYRKWTPMGIFGNADTDAYRGIFDGNGKSISGLNVIAEKNGIGFIGKLDSGTVKNFTVYGCIDVEGKHDNIGGIVGWACGDSIISGVTSNVDITLKGNAHGSNRVAGLVGCIDNGTIIENCIVYGYLHLGENRAQDGVGGLVGKSNSTFTGAIRNCAAYGIIQTGYKSLSYNEFDTIFIGGILSNCVAGGQATIENCIWAGSIINDTDLLTENARISAFGTMNGTMDIRNCYYLENSAPFVTTNNRYFDYFTAVTEAQLASGEIAYKLGEAWGQTCGEGKPVLGGDTVYYGYFNCVQTGYSNTELPAEATDHDLVREITTAPDCLNDGVATISCRNCSYEKTETVPSNGHSYVEGVCDGCGAVDPDYFAVMKGDINGDGEINVIDTNIAKRILSGIVSPTADQLAASDVNGDGVFNGFDANILVRYISGGIDSFN